MERSTYEVEPVLQAVARTMQACLGFGTVVVNLHRPAWDDFETVVIVGSDDARDVLLGQTSSTADWAPLLDPRFERRGAYHVKEGEYDWSQDPLTTWVPSMSVSADPDAWSPEDALFVPLRSAAGDVLGILSVDEPADGRRPDDEKLDLVVGVAQHAALALEHAQEAAAAERQRVSVGHLLRLTASLAERRTIGEMLDAVCHGIRDALGFEKVAVALEGEQRMLELRSTVGMTDDELARLSRVPLDAVAPLLDPALERDGVVLLERGDAQARVDPSLHGASFGRLNGRGARAWEQHVLIVPLRDREGGLEGAVWVDDPRDRLLPSSETLQALRAFANHAMSAVESARQLELMRHLAEHDPLTGLRNRRGLQEHIDAEIARTGTVAVMVCDLDNFKRVNDTLGYVEGDEALRRFAGVLAASGGLAARLGGEEFAVVLPGCDEDAALAAGERVRSEVAAVFHDFPWPVTTSVGVAVTGPGARTPRSCCAPPRAPCSAPSGSGATAASPTTPRRSSRCSARSTRAARRASSSPPRCCWPRRSTCATSVRRATRRPSAATPRRSRASSGCRTLTSSASAPRVCSTTSASSASPTPCSRSPASSPTRSGSRCAAIPSWERGSSTTPICATSARGCSRTTSGSTAAATRTAWPAT